MKHLRKDYDRIQDPALHDPLLLSPGSTAIGEDEPVFLLRAKDGAAVDAVLAWCDRATEMGADPNLVGGVRAWAAIMLKWRCEHVGAWGEVPDAPADQLKI